MQFEEFSKITLSFWRERLSLVHKMVKVKAGLEHLYKATYPSMLLVTNCNGFFVAELVGCVEGYQGLTLKKLKSQSTHKYLSQFDDRKIDPLMHLDVRKAVIRNCCLARELDEEKLKERFPALDLFGTKLIGGTEGALLTFGNGFESLEMGECFLVNQRGSAYRCKYITALFMVAKNITSKDLKLLYKDACSNEQGMTAVRTRLRNDEVLTVAGLFQNIYLAGGLHETTIGEFIKTHPDIIFKALSCTSFLQEKSFKWIKKPYDLDDGEIRPDLLVRRSDGCYDIYDLKTAALNEKNLIRGKSSRKRFIDYVHEGVAQLRNYAEYFKIPENAQYARDKHDVVVEDPKLVLIVGNWDNADPHEVARVVELYNDVTVIDYDTLCGLYVSAASVREEFEKA